MHREITLHVEQSFAFGSDHGLVGTLTRPSCTAGANAPQGLLLFNAGVLPRTGPHRINVKLARGLASKGVATLRFDLHGHGDSARADGHLGYYQQADSDLREAMDELGRRAGARKFAILGFCSGAYPAFRAALADPRVNAVLLYDGFVYPTRRATMRRYRMRIRQYGLTRAVGGWLWRGTSGALARLAAGLRDWRSAFGSTQRVSEVISRAELVRGLNTLVERGVRVTVLAAGDSLERTNYTGQFRDATSKYGLSDRVITEFLPEINHVATSLRSQQLFLDFVVERWLQLDAAAQAPLPQTDAAAASLLEHTAA